MRSTFLAAVVLVVLGTAAPRQPSRAQSPPAPAPAAAAGVDPNVRGLLAAMVEAYRVIRSIDQDTTYDEGANAAGDMARLHMAALRPNRLLLQVWRHQPSADKPVETRLVCDGRKAWTWVESPGYYTEDPAPRSMAGFRDRIVSLELAMLVGQDPFTPLLKRARAAAMGTPGEVHGVSTDQVVLDLSDDARTLVMRLDIGQRDHLLRRCAMESRTLPYPVKQEDGTTRMSEPGPALKFGYTSVVQAGAALVKETFHWVPPAGAYRYQAYPNLSNLDDFLAHPSLPGAGTPVDAKSQQKMVPLQDIIKQSRKRR